MIYMDVWMPSFLMFPGVHGLCSEALAAGVSIESHEWSAPDNWAGWPGHSRPLALISEWLIVSTNVYIPEFSVITDWREREYANWWWYKHKYTTFFIRTDCLARVCLQIFLGGNPFLGKQYFVKPVKLWKGLSSLALELLCYGYGWKLVFGSDRSPRRGGSVCACDTLCIKGL